MSADQDKRFSTLQARAALGGVTLFAIDGDHGQSIFIASRWALTRPFDSLDDVAIWLDRVIGREAQHAAG